MKLVKAGKDSKYLSGIEDIYLDSFPRFERIKFDDLVSETPDCNLYAIIGDEKLVGLSYIRYHRNENLIYIIYLAVDRNERNKLYGSRALKEIDKLYPTKCKALCVEKPNDSDIFTTKRVSFYTRNGYKLKGFEFELLGHRYCSMSKGNFNPESFKNILIKCFPDCKNFTDIGE